MSTLNFYLDGKSAPKGESNFFYLSGSSWDDYTSRTSFYLYFSGNNSRVDIPIGSLKLMHFEEDTTKDILPKKFETLPFNEYCSLGQDLEYYLTLKRNFPEDYYQILKALNDAAFFDSIADNFRHHHRFKHSLLRNSEAEKAFYEAKKDLEGERIERNFVFTYQTSVRNSTEPHIVEFNFDTKSKLPNRIVGIIGENGTGKTQLLANLAMDLSGNGDLTSKKVAFSNERPLFSKVIAISYSIFDKFARPEADHSFSYKYCGLKDIEGKLLSTESIHQNYNDSIGRIKVYRREKHWYETVSTIIGEHQTEELYESLLHEGDFEALDRLSSGQIFLVYVLTQLIGNIKPNSLVLFDEPEMHLHPNAISNLIRSLDNLLTKFDSYAIIATHSPIIIQEIPSKFIKVFSREGDTPYIYDLNVESFGESIEILSQEVFKTKDVEDNYKKFFKRISKQMSYKQVLKLFHNSLSLNAKSYLISLYKNPGKELE
ncbi:AAA domain-containing protein, putative AbiEii toxin, Type IV TA system [Salegentibacter echinorum]|uniref:AAA domain-containing protein, putative AbiEii toxin, Type IV TA system n=1 Tax=Salegentibacter echinorum TaxID=1073325 RepID=A0A1M5DLY2_SALEC|nr:AAA family ATPase [Salegentibacter echinorum]SHF67916.1 AAA domain-containing protein, putative AbiEii toxin, Type IV TA system [Salegentibacter echinorum]